MYFSAIVSILLLIICQTTLAYKFHSIPTKIYLCPNGEDISNIVDVSNIEIIYTDEDAQLNGYIVWKHRFAEDDILQGIIRVEKFQHGIWAETGYTISRRNLCATFFNKKEAWHSVMEDLKNEEKNCPPEPGSRLTFNYKSTVMKLDEPSRDVEGRYRFIVNIKSKNMRLCFIVEADNNLQ